jgi:hypothetical protein
MSFFYMVESIMDEHYQDNFIASTLRKTGSAGTARSNSKKKEQGKIQIHPAPKK